MGTPDPLRTYLRELERELHVRGMARRRILAELRAHLIDAVEAEQSTGADERVAAERAVVRLGLAGETARQFNHLDDRRRAILRRALLPWIAAVALSLTATASVWAFHAGPPARQHARAHPQLQARCVQRAGAVTVAHVRGFPRAFPPLPQTPTVCGMRHTNAP